MNRPFFGSSHDCQDEEQLHPFMFNGCGGPIKFIYSKSLISRILYCGKSFQNKYDSPDDANYSDDLTNDCHKGMSTNVWISVPKLDWNVFIVSTQETGT